MSSGEDIRYQCIFKAGYIIFKLKLAPFQTLDFQFLKCTRRNQVINSIIKIAVLNLELDYTFPDVF